MQNSMASLDELRAAHPALGFALYALTPGEAVTLEILTTDGGLFSFTGASAAEVIATAFPPATPQRPASSSSVSPTEANVFE